MNKVYPDAKSALDGLLKDGNELFAYALSFAVIGRMWFVHHRFFGGIAAFSGGLIFFSSS